MKENIYAEAKILIVDDQLQNIELLIRILKRGGYSNILSTTEPTRFMAIYEEYQPDLVLLDLHMPELDGFELLSALEEVTSLDEYIPVVVLTADTTSDAKRKALAAGATDFLTKPLDRTEVLLRINNLLEARRLHLRIHAQNQSLEQKVAERTHMLEKAQYEILECMAKATEYRDDATGKHIIRVGELSAELADALGMPPSQTETLRLAAPLHDVGKIGVSDTILLKPAKLTYDEYELMKSHTWIGYEILDGTQFPILQMAQEIAISHHENWDGTGYPNGLKGDEIPVVGQIVAIVDVFDALTHQRPYKEPWTVEQALQEIENLKGRKFGPELVDHFLELINRNSSSKTSGKESGR